MVVQVEPELTGHERHPSRLFRETAEAWPGFVSCLSARFMSCTNVHN